MASATIFSDFHRIESNKALIIISNDIQKGVYKNEIEKIREAMNIGDKTLVDSLKKQLKAFTPSATFKDKRLLQNIVNYSGFIHLDFDKIPKEYLLKAKEIIAKIPYTAFCFISPSGNGLKVFIEVNTGIEHHKIAYIQVMKYYEEKLSIKADEKCSDVTRLCFMSYDKDLYKNINSEKFIVVINDIIPNVEIIKNDLVQKSIPNSNDFINPDTIELFKQQILFTNNKFQYQDGNRNHYIYNLAANCNRVGLSESDTALLCTTNFDLPQREIQQSVNSVYKNRPNEFAKIANVANPQTESEDVLIDYLLNTPTIPDEVFSMLPKLLFEGTSAFKDKRKRDVFLTSALSIMSGCLPEVTGIYAQERVYPHLFTFVIAPAASGKGVLKNAQRLADKYHQKVLDESVKTKQEYDTNLSAHKLNCKTAKKGDIIDEEPQKPPFKLVFIPANCSHSRMIEHLQNNGGQAIICETEADTMSGTKKQDWGDYSPTLRAAFHHEKINLSRKTNDEYIEIVNPRIAVSLSGTPAQAPRLITSAEDGLFSRFLFYAFKNYIQWQDPSPNSHSIIYNEHFDQLGNDVLSIINYLENASTNVCLTENQWNELNNAFDEILSEVTVYTSEDAASSVYRLGLILFRICMIFTALRKVENGDLSINVYCSDNDFNCAMLLIKTYLQHSILMFNNLSNAQPAIQFKSGDNKRLLFENLPIEFTRKEAIILGEKYKLSARTVDDLLRSSVGKLLNKTKPGFYQKTTS